MPKTRIHELPGQSENPKVPTNESLDLSTIDAYLMSLFPEYKNLCVAIRAMVCVDARCALQTHVHESLGDYANSVGRHNVIPYALSLVAMFNHWGVEA